jgi:hypothetical protein
MKGTGYAEITIRDFNGERRETRKCKNKNDFFEVLDKHGETIINLSWEELLELWRVPVTEVEDYVRRKRNNKRKDRTRSAIR